MGRLALRSGVLLYLAVIVLAPVLMVIWRTFSPGLASVEAALGQPGTVHAVLLTLLIMAVAVPVNTAFGLGFALAAVRGRMPLRGLLSAVVDLPLALSPVVAGFSLYLLYGRDGWFGAWLTGHGVQVLFAPPGMILATIFVSLPFAVRELVPVLEELGTDQEQAAATLGASRFEIVRRITLPALRPAIVCAVVLTAAFSLGEYGAVSVVSGQIAGVTDTMTIEVQQAYDSFDGSAAYVTAVALLVLALLVLVAVGLLRPKEGLHGDRGQ